MVVRLFILVTDCLGRWRARKYVGDQDTATDSRRCSHPFVLIPCRQHFGAALSDRVVRS